MCHHGMAPAPSLEGTPVVAYPSLCPHDMRPGPRRSAGFALTPTSTPTAVGILKFLLALSTLPPGLLFVCGQEGRMLLSKKNVYLDKDFGTAQKSRPLQNTYYAGNPSCVL